MSMVVLASMVDDGKPVRTLLTALSWRLHAAGVAVFNPSGIYDSADTAVTWKVLPGEPDRVLALNVYSLEESPNPADSTRVFRVQLRGRSGGDPVAVDDLLDAAHTALEAHHAEWSGLRIDRSHRISVAQMGADSNRRQERADNYEIRTH